MMSQGLMTIQIAKDEDKIEMQMQKRNNQKGKFS